MKRYRVVFAPEAEEQILSLYRYIADAASAGNAARYTEAVVDCCESLCLFPQRGVLRNDIRPGLRITHYKGRTVIAYAVGEDSVSILGVFYGGQDYEQSLQDDV